MLRNIWYPPPLPYLGAVGTCFIMIDAVLMLVLGMLTLRVSAEPKSVSLTAAGPSNVTSLARSAQNFLAGSSYVTKDASLKTTNDTVCKFVGYSKSEEWDSQMFTSNDSRAGLLKNGSLFFGAKRPGRGDAFYTLNVTEYLEDTVLFSTGSFDTSSWNISSERPRDKRQFTMQRDTKPLIIDRSLLRTEAEEAGRPPHHLVLNNLNGTIWSNGTWELPWNATILHQLSKDFWNLALAYNATLHGGPDSLQYSHDPSVRTVNVTNPTLSGFLRFAIDLSNTHFALAGLSTDELNADMYFPGSNGDAYHAGDTMVHWYNVTENCLATGNHSQPALEEPELRFSRPVELRTLRAPQPGEVGIWHINRCEQPFFFKTEGPEHWGRNTSRVGSNEQYFVPYLASKLGGMSVKIADRWFDWLTGDMGIVQFEYHAMPERSDRMQMDLSFIDCGPHLMGEPEDTEGQRDLPGCPMREGGWLARWIDEDGLGCPFTYCPGVDDPNEGCVDAYMEPSDNLAVKTCVFGDENWDQLNFALISCPSKEDLEKVGM